MIQSLSDSGVESSVLESSFLPKSLKYEFTLKDSTTAPTLISFKVISYDPSLLNVQSKF